MYNKINIKIAIAIVIPIAIFLTSYLTVSKMQLEITNLKSQLIICKQQRKNCNEILKHNIFKGE